MDKRSSNSCFLRACCIGRLTTIRAGRDFEGDYCRGLDSYQSLVVSRVWPPIGQPYVCSSQCAQSNALQPMISFQHKPIGLEYDDYFIAPQVSYLLLGISTHWSKSSIMPKLISPRYTHVDWSSTPAHWCCYFTLRRLDLFRGGIDFALCRRHWRLFLIARLQPTHGCPKPPNYGPS